jgi:hypothetical protein
MNSTVEAIIRTYTNKDQNNWATLCPVIELMVNARTAASTGFSPFYLSHGYELSPFPEPIGELAQGDEYDEALSMQERGQSVVARIHQAMSRAQAAMAYAQAQQETQANRHREAAPRYKVGDQVWLDLKNIKTTRRSKKLDWKHAKFTVLKVIDPHSVQLDVPGQTKEFHVDLLRPASSDPFPSQDVQNSRPTPVVVVDYDGQERVEYEVQEITDEYVCRGSTMYTVQWKGYPDPTAEPLHHVQDSAAYEAWLTKTTDERNPQGKLKRGWRQRLQRRTLSERGE